MLQATCFYGSVKHTHRSASVLQCQPHPPYLLRAESGAVEALAEVGGVPLGLFDGMGYTGQFRAVEAGRRSVFVYRWRARSDQCRRLRFHRRSPDGHAAQQHHSELPRHDRLCHARAFGLHCGRPTIGRHHDAFHAAALKPGGFRNPLPVFVLNLMRTHRVCL